VGDITWAKASYDSVRGRIESHWMRDADGFKLNIVIPANATATVFLPAKSLAGIREGGKVLKSRPGVKSRQFDKDRAIISVGSGRYEFTSDWRSP
jgi:alpha-L-rhamnosidase